MPYYEFVCKKCNAVHEYFMHVSDFSTPDCLACGGEMRQRYHPPAGIHIFEERHHAGLGERVKSRHHMREVMKKKEEEYFDRRGEVIKFEEPI